MMATPCSGFPIRFERRFLFDRQRRQRCPTAHRPLPRLPATGDNGAMGKPFQFSMRRLFLAMTFFCLAAWCFSVLLNAATQRNDGVLQVSLIGLFTFVGAGIGAISGRSLAGICWAMLLLFLLWVASIVFLPSVQT
jgi:hypothetical protein